MALGKYSRVDGRKSSSGYCSTVTIVVFVALCLVGVWMMTSSSVVPGTEVENKKEDRPTVPEIKDDTTNNEETNTATEDNVPTDEGKQKQFEDNPGDLPDDATKGDTSLSTNQEKNDTPEETEKPNEEKPEDKSGDDKKDDGEEKKDGSKDDSDRESKVENPDSEAGETKETNLDNEKKPEEDSGKTDGEKEDGQIEEKVEKEKDEKSDEKKDKSSEVFPSGAQSELSDESTTQNGSFSTQAAESKNEKEAQKSSEAEKQSKYSWKVCSTTAGPDYIPCLDNLQAIKKLPSTKHYEHRERHCPANPPTCLVPLPEGYQRSIEWPTSREKVQHVFENAFFILFVTFFFP